MGLRTLQTFAARDLAGRAARLALAASCALLFVTAQVFAQSAKGGVTGTVTDPNGAVVVGATVEATSEATGEKRTATTTDQGVYTIPNLNVGAYTLTVSAPGFSSATVQDVTVTVSFTLTRDVQLGLAGAQEVVTVSSGDAQTAVNTTDQQLSTLIDNQKIIDLPLLARNPNSLLLLAPNTTTSTGSLGGIIVNGQSERNNNFQVDGIDNNDADVPGGLGGIATPTIDATQEFRVITSNFNAEFGRNAGGLVNVVTRGGSNEFHGNAYIYYRSDRFSARDFFDVSGSPDPLQRRQYGGSIGGPVVKNKFFFFFNYERDLFDQGVQITRTVPSARARQGIFDVGGSIGTITFAPNSPNNRSGTVQDIIFGLPPGTAPNLGVNPAIAEIINAVYPLGNSPGEGLLPGVFDTYRFSDIFSSPNYAITTREDFRINDKHNLTGSFTFGDGTFDIFAETFPGTGDASVGEFKSYLLSLNLTSTFTPSLVNELRFGGNRVAVVFNGPGDGPVGLGPYDVIRRAFERNGAPVNIQPFGGPNGQNINLFGGTVTPLAQFDTQFRYSGTTNFADALTWIKGNHTFKFGGETRFVYSNGASNFGRNESLDFNLGQFGTTFAFLRNNQGAPISNGTVTGQALNNFATFLAGYAVFQNQTQFFSKGGTRIDADYRGFRQREIDFFFQDTWKLRPNLSLNYGLRYEYKGVPFEVNGLVSNLVGQDPSGPTPPGGFVFQTVGKNSDNPDRTLYENDYNNFAPRFGFNYSPSFEGGFLGRLTGGPGNSSIRGGYGVFYDRVFSNLVTNLSGNPPFSFSITNRFVLDTIQNIPRAETLTPTAVVREGDEQIPLLFPLPGNNPFQEKFATPYTQSWNFGVQRQFGPQVLFEADYIGSKGTNLLRQADANLTSVLRVRALTGEDVPLDPTDFDGNIERGSFNTAFAQPRIFLAIGHSTYHAGAFRLTKRLNNRLGAGQFQAAYTLSHSIDNVADPLPDRAQSGDRSLPRDSSGFGGGFNAERGNSGFDTRHRFVGNFVYELPFKFENGLLNQAFGGWAMTGILTLQSGQPFSVFTSVDATGTGVSQRASFAGPGQGFTPAPNSGEVLRPDTQVGPSASLFRNPSAGERGNVPRNFFYGRGYQNFDFSLQKRFAITETVRLRFQADFFNLTNNVNLLNPNVGQSNATQLIVTSPNFGQSTTASPPRRIQFAARIDF
jgi:hypothetical protein